MKSTMLLTCTFSSFDIDKLYAIGLHGAPIDSTLVAGHWSILVSNLKKQRAFRTTVPSIPAG